MGRNLLNRPDENVGIDQRMWLLLETGGYGDAATNSPGVPTSGSCGHNTLAITYNIPRTDSKARSGRSSVARLSGKKEAKFTAETYIIPGTPDGSNHPTLPETHPFLYTAFGAYTLVGGTLTYSLAQATTESFRILEEGTHFSRVAVGAYCDQVTFSLPGDGQATMKFSGAAQDVYFAGQATLSVLTDAAHTAVLQTGQGATFDVGSWVDVIAVSDGNTSDVTTPRQITGISDDTLTLSGAVFSAAEGDYVIGYAPAYAPMDAENALLGLKGTFSTANFGTISGELLKAEIDVKNNYTDKIKMYGTSKTTGFVADKRRAVMVKLTILLTAENLAFYTANKQFIADDLTITLAPQDIPAPENSATGRTLTFNLPRVEFNVPELSQPADGFIQLSLEGVALSTDAATPDAELTLTVT